MLSARAEVAQTTTNDELEDLQALPAPVSSTTSYVDETAADDVTVPDPASSDPDAGSSKPVFCTSTQCRRRELLNEGRRLSVTLVLPSRCVDQNAPAEHSDVTSPAGEMEHSQSHEATSEIGSCRQSDDGLQRQQQRQRRRSRTASSLASIDETDGKRIRSHSKSHRPME